MAGYTEELALSLMAKHNLSDWRFRLSETKDCLGRCFDREKTIEFSQFYLHLPQKEIKDTILHEIAHALAGSAAGHSYIWENIARNIGASGNRCGPIGVQGLAEAKYYGICLECNHIRKFYRRPMRTYSCGKCSPYRYDPSVRLEIVENV